MAAYDRYERVWLPPMPVIFQRRIGIESRPSGIDGIRRLLNAALASAGLTDAIGRPLSVHPPRLPENLYDRGRAERDAAAHRPADTRA